MSVLNDVEMGLQHLKNNLESYCAVCPIPTCAMWCGNWGCYDLFNIL